MSYEFPESSIFILRRGISASQVPTRWPSLFYHDESTNTICIKSVEITQLSSSHSTDTYDMIETDSIQDDTQALGFAPNRTRKFYFAFPDEVKSGFYQAVEACRGLPSTSPASVEAVDSALEAAAGISLLSSPIMCELLLFIAIGCNVIFSRRTPHHAQTICAIASAGPPSSEPLTTELRQFIEHQAYNKSPRAEVGLLMGGWRKPFRSFTILSTLNEDDFSRDSHLEEDVRDLLNVLIEREDVHFSPEPNGSAFRLLVDLAEQGSLKVLRMLLGNGGFLPIEKVPLQTRADMLIAAVSAVGLNCYPNRRPMIAYLLREIEVDPNFQGLHWAGTKPGHEMIRLTALHVAVRRGDTETADLLLEMGASMDARDAEGRTP